MRINIVRVSRKPRWPFWAVAIVMLWLALGSTVLLLSNHFDRPIQLCLFKHLTGVPCPTCGLTRGGVSLLKGRFVQAWLFNPLLFTILVLLFAAVVIRLVFGRAVQIRLTQAEKIIALVSAGILLAVNWVYVILYVK
jgi:hypothetical protein